MKKKNPNVNWDYDDHANPHRNLNLKEKRNIDGLTLCARECKDGKCCKMNECRLWLDHKEDKNCTLVAIYNNDQKPMTLREIAERLDISFARVKQIETKAFSKLKKHLGEKPY